MASIVVVMAAVVTLTASSAGRAASAVLPKDVPLQPGAPMIDAGSSAGSTFCTLNFVFKDKAKKVPNTYIATAKYCTDSVGTRASSPHVGSFGTIVYRNECCRAAHFALIRIDRAKLKYVSPVVRGFGAAPTGYTTSKKTNPGDVVVSHGYPYAAAHPAEAVTRVGVLGDDSSTRYWSSLQPNIHDSGSPVIRLDGKAVGMSDELSSFWGTWLPEAPPIARYPTIEGFLKELKYAGFNVTLSQTTG